MRWRLVLPGLLVLAGAPVARGETPALEEACREALPAAMAEAAEPGAVRGATTEGEWWIESAEMDGAGDPEAILVILPANRSGQVRFFGHKDGKVWDKKVKLGSAPVVRVSVRFEPFAEGRSLAHVDGGAAGQALLHWDRGSLKTVWKVGSVGDDERHWITVEDLDEDGVGEVIVYYQRELDDFFADEDDLDESTAGGDASEVDVVAVHRWTDGGWKKDKKLLGDLR